MVLISVVLISAAAAAENTTENTTDHEFFELKLLFHKISSGASGASGSPVHWFTGSLVHWFSLSYGKTGGRIRNLEQIIWKNYYKYWA